MKMAVAGRHREAGFSPFGVLTWVRSDAYITAFGTPPPRCDGASSKLLTDIGDQAPDPKSEAVGFDGSPVHRGFWNRLGSGLFDK